MCQDKRVVAVATLTPKEDKAKIVYKGRDGKMNTKEIKIVKNANNSEYYGGTLEIDDELKQVLHGKITTMSNKEYNGPLFVFNRDTYFHVEDGACLLP